MAFAQAAEAFAQATGQRLRAFLRAPATTSGATLFLLAGPPLALAGNSASDMYLVLVVLGYLSHSAACGRWQWTRQAWLGAAFLFWLWMLASALLSQWPIESLKTALPWIRFPLYGAVLGSVLAGDRRLRTNYALSLLLALLGLIAILAVERYHDPGAGGLSGPWTQKQASGWFLFGVGLPAVIWSLDRTRDNPARWVWALPLVSVYLASAISSGNVYASVICLFGLLLYGVLARLARWIHWAGLGLVCAGLVGFLFTRSPGLHSRFAEQAVRRLPWRESSDYYPPWQGALRIARDNPLAGVGADNYQRQCEWLKWAEGIFVQKNLVCYLHPHQLYLQIAAETGLPGLALFSAMAALLFARVGAGSRAFLASRNGPMALALLTAVFWPISTYANAFGQHLNFFSWTAIGAALAWGVRRAGAAAGEENTNEKGTTHG